MANYEQLQNDYPGLAAMFQKLQDGIQESALVSNSNAAADIYTAGEWLSGIARLESAARVADIGGKVRRRAAGITSEELLKCPQP